MKKKNIAISVRDRPNHPLFNGDFKNDQIKQIQWNAFLRKMKYKGVLSLNEVVDYITEKLSPYWLSLKK